jgi:hypothetical protein
MTFPCVLPIPPIPERSSDVISERDAYRSAQILIEEQGVGAFALAVGRASGFVMEGDADQATTWRRIAEAIRELQRLQPEAGEAVH